MPVLVRELLTRYARADAAALPRVTPYRDYLAWLCACLVWLIWPVCLTAPRVRVRS